MQCPCSEQEQNAKQLSGHMAFIHRRINVAETSWRCINTAATLFQRCVSAGIFLINRYPMGTWRLYNVTSTLMQRHDVNNVACPLGERPVWPCSTIHNTVVILYYRIWTCWRDGDLRRVVKCRHYPPLKVCSEMSWAIWSCNFNKQYNCSLTYHI